MVYGATLGGGIDYRIYNGFHGFSYKNGGKGEEEANFSVSH